MFLPKFRWLVWSAAGLGVALLSFISWRYQILDAVQDAALHAFAPVGRVGWQIGQEIGSWGRGALQLRQLPVEVERLRNQQAELLSRYSALLLNYRLRQTQDQVRTLPSFPGYQLVISRLIGREQGDERWLIIDRGQEQGIAIGQAALAPAGILVGQVVSAGAHNARLRWLTDQRSSVTAAVESEGRRSVGVLQGSHGLGLQLRYLPAGASVQVNDLVVSAGLEGGLPPGLPIGLVSRALPPTAELFWDVSVQSSIDWSALEYVAVAVPE